MHSPDFVLSSGREVYLVPMANGAKDVTLSNGGEMTEAEWTEYCDHCAEVCRRIADKVRLRKLAGLLDFYTRDSFGVVGNNS